MPIVEKLKGWYRGEYVPPPENDPNSRVVFVSAGHYEQPALAKCLGAIGRFWTSHWQWAVGTTLAIVAILVAK